MTWFLGNGVCYKKFASKYQYNGTEKIFPRRCIRFCKENGYGVAGLTNGKECYCRNGFPDIKNLAHDMVIQLHK